MDSVGNFQGQGFPLGMEQSALARRELVQQLRIRGRLASGKGGKARSIGHPATHPDQFSHTPDTIRPLGRMMLEDNGFEVARQLPIHNELPAHLTMIPAKQLPFGLKEAARSSTMRPQ